MSQPTVEELRAGLLQMMKDSGDLMRALQARTDLVFDNTFPWHLVHKLGATGRECRNLLGEHHLADLTNDPEFAATIRKVLNPPENKDEDDEC